MLTFKVYFTILPVFEDIYCLKMRLFHLLKFVFCHKSLDILCVSILLILIIYYGVCHYPLYPFKENTQVQLSLLSLSPPFFFFFFCEGSHQKGVEIAYDDKF